MTFRISVLGDIDVEGIRNFLTVFREHLWLVGYPGRGQKDG